MRGPVLPSFLQLIAELLLGFASGSVYLLCCSLNIRLDLLVNLVGLLFKLLLTLLIIKPFLVPCATRQLISHLVDCSLNILLRRIALGQRVGRRGPRRRLSDLALQSLQLALQLIELLFGSLDLFAGQGCHRVWSVEIGALGSLGPLLGLFGIVGDFLSGLRDLLGRIGSLHGLEYFSCLLIDLCLQPRILGFLLQSLHYFASLGIFLLQFPFARFGLFAQLIGNLLATSRHVLGLSNLLIAHQGLGGLGFGQLGLPLLVLFERTLIDELIQVWIHFTELLLGFLDLFHKLIGFLLE